MKNVLFAAVMFAMSNGFAKDSVTHFDCSTTNVLTENVKHSVKFDLINIDSALVDIKSEDELITIPEYSPFAALIENQIVQKSNTSITISGDSDGFFLIQLVLDKKTGYKTGMVKVKDLGGEFGGNKSSAVICVVNQ